MGFFVGQVMKATGGRAEPQLAQQLLREELGACLTTRSCSRPARCPVPPEVLAVHGRRRSSTTAARPSRHLRRGAAQAQARLPHRGRRAALHGLGHGRVRVRLRQPGRAGRSRAVRHRRAPSATAGWRWREPTAPRSTVLECEWGDGPIPPRSPWRVTDATPEARRGRALRDLDRRRRGHPGDRRGHPRPQRLLAIDAVSSLGAVPIETDAWGLDVVVSGSQKGCRPRPGSRSRASRRRAWSAAARPARRASTSTGSARSTRRQGRGARSRPRPRP